MHRPRNRSREASRFGVWRRHLREPRNPKERLPKRSKKSRQAPRRGCRRRMERPGRLPTGRRECRSGPRSLSPDIGRLSRIDRCRSASRVFAAETKDQIARNYSSVNARPRAPIRNNRGKARQLCVPFRDMRGNSSRAAVRVRGLARDGKGREPPAAPTPRRRYSVHRERPAHTACGRLPPNLAYRSNRFTSNRLALDRPLEARGPLGPKHGRSERTSTDPATAGGAPSPPSSDPRCADVPRPHRRGAARCRFAARACPRPPPPAPRRLARAAPLA